MIADSHTHIFFPEAIQDRASFFSGEPSFRALYENPKARLVGAEQLIRSMDENEVEFSVTFGFPWESAELCKVGNDYVLEQAAKYSDRLVPFATLPCCSIDEALAEMDRCAKAGAAGFGELSFYGADNDIAGRWQTEVGNAAAGMGKITLWHVAEDVGHDYPGKSGMNAGQAAALVDALCGATVILAHWGGGLPFFELMPELAKTCAGVYYDTAASPYLYDKKIFDLVARIVGSERILFGSDYPLLSPKRYIDQVRSSGLDQKQADAVLGGNLLRLLGRKST